MQHAIYEHINEEEPVTSIVLGFIKDTNAAVVHELFGLLAI